MANLEAVLAGIVETISAIADEESQRRLWLGARTDDYDSPDEVFCRFFDDYNADHFIDNDCLQSPLASREQCLMLAKFRDALNEYSNRHGEHLSPEVLLVDPEWHHVCQMARDVIAMFNVQKERK
jgi:hypothetical protein